MFFKFSSNFIILVILLNAYTNFKTSGHMKGVHSMLSIHRECILKWCLDT